MILRNLEGVRALDIAPDWHANRQPGLSGLLRLKDEADWVALAIDSFLPWLDELVIVCQPCSDRTREIVEGYASDPKVKIADYPVAELHPSGPGHDDCPAGSLRSSAFYYNFCLALSSKTHAVKLDGDLVMQDGVGERIRALMDAGHDRIKLYGVDIVGDELRHVGSQIRTPTDGVYLVEPQVRYTQGPFSQSLAGVPEPTAEIEGAFLHFKWCKPVESAIKRWPEDWREKEHFQRIFQRRVPVRPYAGEYPASVAAML